MLNTDIITIVSEEIAYFLTTEKQAAIPGFGRFVSVAQSAMISDDGSELNPPSNAITFEQNLEEADTKFVEYYEEYHSQGAPIDEFVTIFISKIKDEKSVLLPELGLCILNKEGVVHFEGLDQSTNVFGFASSPVYLKPVSNRQTVTKPAEINAPGEAAIVSKVPIAAQSRSKLIRIGMVLSCLILLIVFLSKYSWTEAKVAEFQKVPTNYNVSPQDQDVIVASMDGDAPSGEISSERKAEILERQRLMSDALPVPNIQVATIVTNTFGSQSNVNKQLNLIAELGYQGSTMKKPNGLTSTLISAEYQYEAELEALLDEIKIHFHRAKLKK